MKSKPNAGRRSDTEVISIRNAEWSERLKALSEASGVPVARLVVNCLEEMLPILEAAESARQASVERGKAARLAALQSKRPYPGRPAGGWQLNEGGPK